MTKSLGERIRELREASDLSLRELARKIGDVSAAFLSDVEFGRRFPSDKTLASLAAALGTTAEDLQQYDSRPPIEEIKRQASANPALGFAFRRMAELPPDELLRRLNEVVPPPKEGKK
ncbi:MAG: helix-turn-helix transcriptional regulator [Geothrix sp.]|nr:helix-turn-helix transcriptional regulator [Geothrix sp.]